MTIQDCQRRNSFAGTAFERYGRELRRFLLRRLHNGEDVRDLAQEVYLRLLRVNQSEQILEPLAYLYRTASNVLTEFHMRRRRERVTFDSEAVDHLAEHPRELKTDELPDRLSTERQLERAMEQLPSLYARILLLRVCDGVSYAEIGRNLEISAHTAEKYYFRAAALLRAAKWD